MKWLGVYFNHKLSFTDHANKMASKKQKAATGLTMLVKTTRGVNATTMQKAVHACILLILTYAAPAWWPGRNHTSAAGQTIHNKVNAHCDKLNKAQNIALCTILPVWKTVLIHILQREVATPSIHHTLDYLCKLTALRLHKLEARHPLRLKTKHAFTTEAPSRIERLAQKCAKEVEYSDPMLVSEPWEGHLFGGREKCLKATGGTEHKERAKTKFNAWLQSLNPLDLLIYTDGSQEINKAGMITGTEAGWVIHWVRSWHGKRGISLEVTHEVYNAEAAVLLGGLKEALNSAISRIVPGIHICLDNLSVAQNA